jgi:hypothetical protein
LSYSHAKNLADSSFASKVHSALLFTYPPPPDG